MGSKNCKPALLAATISVNDQGIQIVSWNWVMTKSRIFYASASCVITILATITVLSGWLLSTFRQLTWEVLFLLILPILLFLIAGRNAGRYPACAGFYLFLWRLKARLKRPLPLLYYIALILGLAGGLIYPPNNYDALSYRIPRILAWISDGGWYWIPTANERMNYSGVVQEWLFSPLLLAFRSYRPFFLVNIILFALMPFLVFSTFRRLGIQERVAWWWMWLLPLSMGIVMQAGGIGNDLLGVFFFLVATDTALRFRETGSANLLVCSVLAVGLCTGVKLSNLPLVLPWIMLIIPLWRKAFSLAWKFAVVVFISIIVSITPILMLNFIHTGSWTGDPKNQYELRVKNPIAGVVGNTILVAVNNLAPPVLPFAKQIESFVNDLPPFRTGSWLTQNYPQFRIPLNELPQEEASGAGFLVTLLLIWSMVRSEKPRELQDANEYAIKRNQAALFFSALVLSALSFLALLGSTSSARLFLPYTAPLVAFALWLRDSSRLVRTRAWFVAVNLCAVLTLVIVVLSPSRPLFPVGTLLNLLRPFAPLSVIERAATVYETYANRADTFADIRKDLDKYDLVLGFLSSGNDLETSLWLPFGSRRVVHLLPDANPLSLRLIGINKVLVSQKAFQSLPVSSQDKLGWLLKSKIISSYLVKQLASQDAETFFLIEIEPDQ